MSDHEGGSGGDYNRRENRRIHHIEEHRSGGMWGPAALVAVSLIGAAYLINQREKGESGAPPASSGPAVAGSPTRVEGIPAATSDTTSEHVETVTTTETREMPITIEGNLGQLQIEVPADRYDENEDVRVALIFDNERGFGACPNDEGCRLVLQGVPGGDDAGAFSGNFSVIAPNGEPNKRMVDTMVPARVTFNGRTVVINPDQTRVRINSDEPVPLRPVLGEPRND